jgi:hypothetical protein
MWSGPLLATMLTVPPAWIFWLLVDVETELVPEFPELEHAARPTAATATAASAPTRLDTVVMSMFLWSSKVRLSEAATGRPGANDHCLPERFCATYAEIQSKTAVVA